jgi:hypothetical protein
VVSSVVHNELDAVLSRDVFRKLVEASAFKSLEAWWENQRKPKVNICTFIYFCLSFHSFDAEADFLTVTVPCPSILIG